jgi:hypothetical protein
MQATYELKKPDRLVIAGVGMLAALVIGGASGYAVKGFTAASPAIPAGQSPNTAGVAAQASDPGFARRALRLELHDQESQASLAGRSAVPAHQKKITQR